KVAQRFELRAQIGDGGWVRFVERGDEEVFVRFVERGHRFVAAELYIAAGEIDTDSLRELRLGRLLSWANSPDGAEGLRERISNASVQMRVLASHYSTRFGAREPDHWVK